MLTTLSTVQRRALALAAAVLLLTGLAVIAASLATTAPTASASSHVSGDGAGVGKWKYASEGLRRGGPNQDACGAFYSLEYGASLPSTSQQASTFMGSVTINDVTYVGPFTIHFEDHLQQSPPFDHDSDDHWHANPSGVYGPDDHCFGDGSYGVDVVNVTVRSPLDPGQDNPGIRCDANQGTSGNNNGTLHRTTAEGVQADVGNVQATCTVHDGDSQDSANNVDITIQSRFAGPCFREPDTGVLFNNNAVPPLPPEHCVTEDTVSFAP